MKHIVLLGFVVGSALSLPIICSAAPKHRAVMVLGHGGQSCGAWTADRQANSIASIADVAWVQGFFTGLNSSGGDGDLTKGTDIDGIAGAIDQYCQAHPLDTVYDAVQDVTVDLIHRALSDDAHKSRN